MKINVVGAGFAGLTVARELSKKGFTVEIFEKAERAGGLISTTYTPYGLVESAAPSMTRTKNTDKLFRELGLKIATPSKASKKRLFYVQKRVSWPLTWPQTAAFLVKALFSKVSGQIQPRKNETVSQWGRRVLTAKGIDNFVGAGLQGIYAGDIEKLSANLVLGPMFQKGREKFKGVIGLEGGMGELIQALENDLKDRGIKINYGASVTNSNLPKPCILATSAAMTANLLVTENPVVAAQIESIRMLPLVSVTAFFEKPAGPQAFGCLVPRYQGLRVLGVLLNSAIFPGRDRKFSETWIFGGATDPEFVHLDRDEIRQILVQERKVIFGKTDLPLDIQLNRWTEALPHYDLVLEHVLKDIREPWDIWFHGNWLGGIGLSKILDRSEKLAERIAKEKK